MQVGGFIIQVITNGEHYILYNSVHIKIPISTIKVVYTILILPSTILE